MRTYRSVWVPCAALLIAFLLGVGSGWVAFAPHEEPVAVQRELRFDEEGRLTNPLLECEVADSNLAVLKPFKSDIESLLNRKIAEGVITEGSVYFRNLDNGAWFGINENLAYNPASMLKVPIMIAYFKLAETDPAALDQEVVYSGEFDDNIWQGVLPLEKLQPGQRYTIKELIARMIILSDNNAARLLFFNMDPAWLNQVFADIDVNGDFDDMDHMLTTHAYSGFFRVLYNASYLNREYSEKALELLSRSVFSDGIRGGLPPQIKAATKFGEFGTGDESDIVQMHEFGIVYYPNRPYLLGIMTRGHRNEAFRGVIKEISQLVYDEVNRQTARLPAPPSRRATPPPQIHWTGDR